MDIEAYFQLQDVSKEAETAVSVSETEHAKCSPASGSSTENGSGKKRSSAFSHLMDWLENGDEALEQEMEAEKARLAAQSTASKTIDGMKDDDSSATV